MITFKLSFLLAFPVKRQGSIQKFKESRSKKGVDGEQQSVLSPTFLGCAHLSYELVPGKIKYDLDVTCWGTISRIASKNEHILMKTIVRNGKAWVPFCVDHNLGHLKLDELKKFREYIVKFSFTPNKSSGRNSIIPCFEIEEGDSFYEIIDGKYRENNLKNYLRILLTRCSNYTHSDPVSWLHGPDSYNKFYKVIEEECSGRGFKSREFIAPLVYTQELFYRTEYLPDKKIKSQTKAIRTGLRRQSSIPEVVIKVPAEVFFTDPTLSIFSEEYSNGIVSNAFVMIAVESLMSKAQKLILNSLIVKIKKLVNVPVNILRECGIASVFFKYDIPFIATCESTPKPISNKIRFIENHIYFTDEIEKVKLIEFLQSQKFYVELYGNRCEMPEEQNYSLFGEEPDDLEISQPRSYTKEKTQKNPNPILLAEAAYDLSSLLENTWDFREMSQCHVPNASLFQKPYANYNPLIFIDVKTANEVNLLPKIESKYHSILQEPLLLELATAFEIEVYLMSPQAASLILHQNPNTFKRILIIFHEEEFAQSFYTTIKEHNVAIIHEVPSQKEQNNPELSDIITGFLLDNGNEFVFFIEGPSNGFILNTWYLVEKFTPKQAKVFFNTDFAFERRLYSHFLGEGLFSVTLKIPLHDILASYHVYVRKNMPVPCAEALKKFSLLFNSSNLKSIFQQNLLPGPRELISLDLEWGVPLRWKQSPKEETESDLF